MQAARIMEFIGVAEKAAIASAEWNGKGDKVSADQAATTAMRDAFNDIDFSGRIVIGEGERDEAPMLYIGEELGRGGEGIDIAVDPLEGTNLCAYNKANALCTIAVAPRGSLLFAPDTYMWKIAAGPECVGKIDIEATPAENIKAVAEALGKSVNDVNVCVLDRERHADLIQACRDAGARVRLIDDGDVFGAIATAVPNTGIDLYMGAGGAPEGVLACTGLKAIGGMFMGKLAFDIDPHGVEKRARAEKTAKVDLDAPLTMDMLVRSDDAAFIASGVTDGEMVSGVSKADGSITTETVVMNALDRTVRFIRTCHRGEKGLVRF
ncbi:MAG: class II fructose-bisphosphatase [Eggerthellaceae bacterium]|nr:class II fructose-bisphosphatase [Eggerthellaceae bacterium]MCH4221158.1 class II fructose-bisphosphatase [Eggerthellaceae bacterium]